MRAELAAKDAELQALIAGGGSGGAGLALAAAAAPPPAAAVSGSSSGARAPSGLAGRRWYGAGAPPAPLQLEESAVLPPPALCESPARGCGGAATWAGEALRPRSPNVAPRGGHGWEPGYEQKFLESVDVRSSGGVLERLNPANRRLLVERSENGAYSVNAYERFSERPPR